MTDLLALPAFADDRSLNVVVESPRGSNVKFKYDLEQGVMTLSRPLATGLTFPYDWGFIPSTCAPDGDPVDAIVLWERSSYPGIVLPCRPIGVLRAEQANAASGNRERNDRVFVVPVKDPHSDGIQTVFDLSERLRAELEQFFFAAVRFEKKDLKLLGWAGPKDAVELVEASLDEQHAQSK